MRISFTHGLMGIIASLSLLAAACTNVVGGGPDTGKIDGGTIDTPPVDAVVDTADTTPDVGPELSVCEEEEGPPPEEGAFGYPCTSNSECNSGWCVPSANGNICTKNCIESCPTGYGCRQLSAGDPVFLCLPQYLHLCDPCEDTSDCRFGESDGEHYCLDRGAEGKFCGGDCSATGECPCGYDCRNVPVGGGQIKAQCLPEPGAQCSCSPLAIVFQDKTSCVLTNEEGSCVGNRACTINGLSDCDARQPEPETCNGLDDNCDGAYDNLPPDYQCTKTNEYGTCLGAGACVGGAELCDAPNAAPEVCDGIDNDCNGTTDDGSLDTDGDTKADCVDEDDDNDTIPDTQDNCPAVVNLDQLNSDGDQEGDACDEDDDNDSVPDAEDCEPLNAAVSQNAVELCDGIDNNCNGLIDDNLCDDGESCTEDSCNGDGTCAHQPKNGTSCEDGEGLCTVSDVCLNGVCTGNPVNCDDGNDCTEDLCNPGNGLCANLGPPKNGELCDDGSACTDDACVNGTCLGTLNPDLCDDGNICTLKNCAAGICLHTPGPTTTNCASQYNGAIPECMEARCQANGTCDLQPADGKACGGPDTCSKGFCQGGACQANTNGTVCGSSDECPPCTDTFGALLGCCFGLAEVSINKVCSGGQCLLDTAQLNGVQCQSGNCNCTGAISVPLCGFCICP